MQIRVLWPIDAIDDGGGNVPLAANRPFSLMEAIR